VPTLDLRTRARVRARVALTTALRAFPDAWSATARDHFATASGRRRAAWAKAAGVLRHKSIAGLGTFTLADRPDVRLVAVDNQIARLLYWYGESGYEPGEVSMWRRFCSRSAAILEVGANIGYYTVQGAIAAPAAGYTAVEAQPDSAEIVRRNVELNGLTNVKVVHAAAVGEQAGDTIDLALPDAERYVAPTGAFVAAGTEGVGLRRAASRVITVPAVGSAQLVDGVTLVKLDIEGMEHAVLAVALPLLLRQRAALFVEVLCDTPQLRAQLVEMLSHDYEMHVLAPAGPVRVDPSQVPTANFSSEYGSRDVVVVPVEHRQWLSS
jgi:FkbM family methyltransferase